MKAMPSSSPCTLAVASALALGAAGCATSPPPTDRMTAPTVSVAGAKAIEPAAAKAVAQDSSDATDLEMQLTDPNATWTDRDDVTRR